MPRPKQVPLKLEDVTITRDGEVAILEPKDTALATTHLTIGSQLKDMTDVEILAAYNECVLATQAMAAEYEHVAVEVPEWSPQVTYKPESDQWVPRGGVVRCLIGDGGEDGEATVEIDDREFSLEEFGRMLSTYAGWGMRIEFVPEDEIDKRPIVEMREPE